MPRRPPTQASRPAQRRALDALMSQAQREVPEEAPQDTSRAMLGMEKDVTTGAEKPSVMKVPAGPAKTPQGADQYTDAERAADKDEAYASLAALDDTGETTAGTMPDFTGIPEATGPERVAGKRASAKARSWVGGGGFRYDFDPAKPGQVRVTYKGKTSTVTDPATVGKIFAEYAREGDMSARYPEAKSAPKPSAAVTETPSWTLEEADAFFGGPGETQAFLERNLARIAKDPLATKQPGEAARPPARPVVTKAAGNVQPGSPTDKLLKGALEGLFN